MTGCTVCQFTATNFVLSIASKDATYGPYLSVLLLQTIYIKF
jgi:hypothetical protein